MMKVTASSRAKMPDRALLAQRLVAADGFAGPRAPSLADAKCCVRAVCAAQGLPPCSSTSDLW
eukprot:5230640-Alexandrium_andersonii.AAC.1